MEDSSWIAPLADELWSRDLGLDTGSGNLRGFQFQTNATSTIINQLKFATTKTIRSSVIILASFNALVAFATAAGIFWESYKWAKRSNPSWRFRKSGFGFIGPAEFYPFILSCGIVIQGITFAVVQSKGLEGLLILGCTLVSQLTLPAIFIVPFIQVIFGLELTFRALQPRPFPSRGRWNTTICFIVLVLSVLVTLVIPFVIPPPNFCFASLFWYVQRYKVGCFGLLVTIVLCLLIGSVVIFIRLRKNLNIDIVERIAASRMVYFLAVAVVSTGLLIPFFFILSFRDLRFAGPATLQFSMVASVVSNLSGLMTGGLHLFLRSSTITTIGPRDEDDNDEQELKKSPRGAASSRDFSYQINQPVAPPQQVRKTASRRTLLGGLKDEEEMIESPEPSPAYTPINPLASNGIPTTQPPQKPEAAQMAAPSTRTTIRQSNYSVFPNNEEPDVPKSLFVLPTTTYARPSVEVSRTQGADNLLPPPRLRSPGHRRDSSLGSTATVQIGLRFSNVNDMPPLTSRFRQSTRVHDLGCPAATPGSKRPSRLTPAQDDDDEYEDMMYSPVPRHMFSMGPQELQSPKILLAPAVYSPDKPQANGSGLNSPARRERSDSQTTKGGSATRRGDWI